MNIWNRFCYFGLYLQPITAYIIYEYLKFTHHPRDATISEWIIWIILSLLPSFYIYTFNSTAKKNGKTQFSPFDIFESKKSSDYLSSNRQLAKYPAVNSKIIKTTPTGIIFGKSRGKYVCKDIEEDGHVFLLGGSGSGKSSCLVIPTLLANPDMRVFATDIKGELHIKASKYGNPHDLIFDPEDRNTFGYDPLYAINENSREQEILEMMLNITFSLIPFPPSTKDPFWINSSRNMLTGLLIYLYQSGIHNLIEIMDEILGRPIGELIEEVISSTDSSRACFRYLIQFSSMPDETRTGVFSEMANHIMIFANDQDIRYALRDNPFKIDPTRLNDGYSIYLCISESKLEAYRDLMMLVYNQVFIELEKRSEDAPPVLFVMDELPRVLSTGKLEHLLDGIRTLRSRKVTLFLISQSLEALMNAYSENEVADLISNCPYIVVLSASSVKTQEAIISWCGSYIEKKTSFNHGFKNNSTGTSYDKENIIEGSDLMSLPLTDEAILISPYGYNRISKTPYYKDKYFKKLADEVKNYNDTLRS